MEQTIESKTTAIKPLRVGDVVEGKIIGIGRSAAYLDLGPQGTGVIYGREFLDEKSALKDATVGATITAKIKDLDNEEGYVELSLREAGREMAWKKVKESMEKEENITVKITGANKGGLLAEAFGIQAFLPVSQLSQEHYPRVENGDMNKVLEQLEDFIGKDLEVQAIDMNPKEDKLILSERARDKDKIKEALTQYKVDQEVEGEITGIVNFGAFIRFGKEEEQVEGLIHISEIDWQIIEDPGQVLKVGEKVKAKIIDITNDKVSLSIKALKEDPWKGVEGKYKRGDVVKGKVKKFNHFGAFVEIEPLIQGLTHISEFGTESAMAEKLKEGETYDFTILEINPEEHRMSLKLGSEPITTESADDVVETAPSEQNPER
ncbi:MAG TPA: S1 RNA-binding domain-containing protein [Candidatus Wildermuthbacteria bacterium]|nr:S1 RNA-binding domain-containing protein [Patescibacteria group bacterium]HEA84430.1 S1 RNA-binding domain-containing protein [Candidatus Wildermuthbacteria bacterium]